MRQINKYSLTLLFVLPIALLAAERSSERDDVSARLQTSRASISDISHVLTEISATLEAALSKIEWLNAEQEHLLVVVNELQKSNAELNVQLSIAHRRIADYEQSVARFLGGLPNVLGGDR